jgi:hypothetical protein
VTLVMNSNDRFSAKPGVEIEGVLAQRQSARQPKGSDWLGLAQRRTETQRRFALLCSPCVSVRSGARPWVDGAGLAEKRGRAAADQGRQVKMRWICR